MNAATNPPRNVLVVAAQCEGGARLDGLEDAARALHAALVDPKSGGCVDRGGNSLLIGTDLGRNKVHDAVEQAAHLAQRDGGPLVLALLGHGEGAEGAPLYFVTSGRLNAPSLSNVNVPALLGDVLNHPGLGGLIAIVDTCLSGGALPSAPVLTAGRQEGNVWFSLLFAATAKEQAFDMRLSTELTRLVEEGLPGAGDFLTVDDALMEQLRERIHGQQPGRTLFDGGPCFGDAPWLARNRAVAVNRTLGAIASGAVRDAVRRIDADLPVQTEEQLAAWVKEHEEVAGTGGSSAAVHRLREVLDELEVGRRTLNVVNKAFGTDLTEDSLRLVGVLAGLPLRFVQHEPPRTLRDLVEYATHHGSTASGRHRALAHLVAAMAHVTRGEDRLPEDVITWAQDLEVTATVNSHLLELNSRTSGERAPRLVLVLADDGGGTVVRVDAWLLFGQAVLGNQRFPCGPRDEDLKSALAEALAWVAPWATIAGKRLKHIDVAAPTTVLLDCPPDEQVVRRQRLGVNYTVTARWSGLLTPPPDVTVDDMLQVGEELLDLLDDSDCCGPQWLQDEQLGTVEQLRDHLSNHGFGQQVWALTSLPAADWDFMAQELLEHTPALVWPRRQDVTDQQAVRASVGRHWQTLPQQIAYAYRRHLSSGGQRPDDGLGPLAALRVTWHDEGWQAFCRKRARAIVRSPDETATRERS